jgi:hypothetical protein
VVSNEIQRFVIRDGKIRANQGHSFAVELGLLATPALDEVYHGTVERLLTAIMRVGLLKMKRQHVHFPSMLRLRFRWASDAVCRWCWRSPHHRWQRVLPITDRVPNRHLSGRRV